MDHTRVQKWDYKENMLLRCLDSVMNQVQYLHLQLFPKL